MHQTALALIPAVAVACMLHGSGVLLALHLVSVGVLKRDAEALGCMPLEW